MQGQGSRSAQPGRDRTGHDGMDDSEPHVATPPHAVVIGLDPRQLLPAMNKLLLLLCTAMFCCNGMIGAMAAAPSAREWNPDDTAPMTNDVASAAARARATHCRTPSCKAIIVIHELVDIARFDLGDANGLASIRASNRPQIAGRRLDRMLLRHPDLYGPVCATGAKLISRFRVGPGRARVVCSYTASDQRCGHGPARSWALHAGSSRDVAQGLCQR